jgi:hypothetical protein
MGRPITEPETRGVQTIGFKQITAKKERKTIYCNKASKKNVCFLFAIQKN